MDIHIAVEGHHDLSGQIYRQLRAGILEGRLAGGTRLPSTRDLATQLGVSRKTTLDVFERLLSEGYLSARAGSGTFVALIVGKLPDKARLVYVTPSHLRLWQYRGRTYRHGADDARRHPGAHRTLKRSSPQARRGHRRNVGGCVA
ncbi:DNA-binding transcriptional regulator YhcF (GntR family) [Paraburkholderia sp. Clong3]